MESTEEEWELSKENIKPLKQGRQMNSLQSVLESPQTLNERLRDEQTRFELEIRTYNGPDPLSVWYEYVQWIQQNYPKGGPHGNLFQVVHSCCKVFAKTEKYFNDERFLDIWMKCINMCSDPLDLFNFMFVNNFCGKLAQFYINWALELEKVEDIKKADGIYVEGINRKAEPIDVLKASHRQFLARITSKVHDDFEEDDALNQRQALNLLPNSKKKPVPSYRVVDNTYDKQKLSLPSSSTSVIANNRYNVFEDVSENAVFPLKPRSGFKTLALDRDKENEINPGKWNENKLKQKTVVKSVPIASVGQQQQLNFNFYEDANEEPLKTPKTGKNWTIALSEKKPQNFGLPVNQDDNPNVKIMYCKEKLYSGGQEISFEELRAARYIARKRKEEQREATHQEILKTISSQMEEWKHEQRKFLENAIKQIQNGSNSPEKIQSLLNEEIQKMTVKMSALEAAENYDVNAERKDKNVEKDNGITEVDKHVAKVQLKPKISNSPTVHTKAALKEMIDLFNGTINTHSPKVYHDNDDEYIITPCKTGPAFTIYSENTEKIDPKPNSYPAFTIYSEDTENIDRKENSHSAFNIYTENNDLEPIKKSVVKSFNFDQYDKEDFTLGTEQFQFVVPDSELTFNPPTCRFEIDFNTSAVKIESTPLKDKSHSKSDISNSKSDGSHTKSDVGQSKVDTNKTVIYIDPFNHEVQQQLLAKLFPPLSTYENLHFVNSMLQRIECGNGYQLGGRTYEVVGKFTGGYATLFKARNGESTNKNQFSALKVQKPACAWEFYISSELKSRLQKRKQIVDVTDSIAHFNFACIFNDGSVLENNWSNEGTLLAAINVYNRQRDPIPEVIVLYFALELLTIVQQMHACQIIHGDIKPDNILLSNLNDISVNSKAGSPKEIFTGKTTTLQLIDFGQSIDMSLFPTDTRFREIVSTEDFVCPEMRDNRDWTYQIDYFGLAATIHCMLFGKYMTIEKVDSKWKLTSLHLKRYWQKDMWNAFFEDWLNIPSCNQLPDLKIWNERFLEAFYNATKVKDITFAIHKLKTLILENSR